MKTGKATLFAPKLPESYSIWYGPLKTREQIRDTYGVDDVQWIDDVSFLHSKEWISIVFSYQNPFDYTLDQEHFEKSERKSIVDSLRAKQRFRQLFDSGQV